MVLHEIERTDTSPTLFLTITLALDGPAADSQVSTSCWRPPKTLTKVYEMGYTPLDLVDVPVGRMTVKLYPKITPAMPVHERAHAFQVNKAALKDLHTDLRLVIDAFGAQLNASSTVEGILSDWRQYFNE